MTIHITAASSGGSSSAPTPFSVAGFTTGTAVDLLPTTGAPDKLTITSVLCGPTAGAANLIVRNNGNIVATIALGTPGFPSNATSLSNTSVNAGDQVTAEIDTAGNAFAIVFFNYT